MKRLLAIIGIAIIVILVILLIKGNGFGFGKGKGDGSGNNSAVVLEEIDVKKANGTKATDKSEEGVASESELPNVIIVTIKEDTVFVGDKQVSNKSELKEYLEEINNDDREFKLIEVNAILDTYGWVVNVFDDLKIQLLEVE